MSNILLQIESFYFEGRLTETHIINIVGVQTGINRPKGNLLQWPCSEEILRHATKAYLCETGMSEKAVIIWPPLPVWGRIVCLFPVGCLYVTWNGWQHVKAKPRICEWTVFGWNPRKDITFYLDLVVSLLNEWDSLSECSPVLWHISIL